VPVLVYALGNSVVPERFDPLNDLLTNLASRPSGREEHEVEVNRIHAALHPECFARLAVANRLERPEEKLELPHFFLSEDADGDDDTSRTPPNLAEDELRIINDLLVQEATRRKAASAGFYRCWWMKPTGANQWRATHG
jgi:hypothetical protein